MQLSHLLFLGLASWAGSANANPFFDWMFEKRAADCTTSITKTTVFVTTPVDTTTKTVTVAQTTTVKGAKTTDYATATATTTTTTTVQTATTVFTSTASTVDGGTTFYTVPTSAGFVAIRDSLPGSGYDNLGGYDPQGKRDVLAAAVKCATTSIFETTSTSTAQASTTTKTVTTTSFDKVTPTTTFLRTTTATTDTVTATTTQFTTTFTSTTASLTTTFFTSTYYAACDQNNLADGVHGQTINQIEPLPNVNSQYQGGQQVYYNVPSAYECCILAFTDGTSNQYSVFEYGVRLELCALHEVAAGAPLNQQSDLEWTVDDYGDNADRKVVGNLYNGVINHMLPYQSGTPSASAAP